jgi:hypothetical protein
MEKQSPSLYSPAIVAMETLAMTATLRLVKADYNSTGRLPTGCVRAWFHDENTGESKKLASRRVGIENAA